MDLPYLANSTFDGIKLVAAVGGSCALGLTALQICSSKISDQKELEKLIAEESGKLGLKSEVKAFLHDGCKAGAVIHFNDSIPAEIHVGGMFARKGVVRHELYHIYKNHHKHLLTYKSKLARLLNYYLKAEFSAQVYGAFGIKL